MAVEVIEKKKRGLTCADCGTTVSKSATVCPDEDCGGETFKKSLVVVRKSVADTDEELEAAVDESEEVDEVEEDEDLEDETEDEDEDLSDEEDEDEDDEDEEEDEEDEDPLPTVKKSSGLIGLEALNISTALAEDIAKVFAPGKKPSRKKYEAVMTELNNVMDAAADNWFAGKVVSKSAKKAPHVTVIQGRVNGIIKSTEGKSKMARPKNFDSLDPETKKYIEELEGPVEKSKISKRADLPEDVRKSLEAADKIVEERESEKWLAVAKGYKNFAGSPEELAKSLRKLSETDEGAYKTLKETLDAAEENLEQSEVFKSFGRPGSGSGTPDAAKEEEIKKTIAANPGMTREQAEVELMNGSAYQPTA